MKMSVVTMEQQYLMNLVIFIPDAFKSVLIFENDEIENFDIGYEEFWLRIKKDDSLYPDSYNKEEFKKYLRDKFSISTTEIKETDEYFVKYFPKGFISKDVFMKTGEVDNSIHTYSEVIKKQLGIE